MMKRGRASAPRQHAREARSDSRGRRSTACCSAPRPRSRRARRPKEPSRTSRTTPAPQGWASSSRSASRAPRRPAGCPGRGRRRGIRAMAPRSSSTTAQADARADPAEACAAALAFFDGAGDRRIAEQALHRGDDVAFVPLFGEDEGASPSLRRRWGRGWRWRAGYLRAPPPTSAMRIC